VTGPYARSPRSGRRHMRLALILAGAMVIAGNPWGTLDATADPVKPPLLGLLGRDGPPPEGIESFVRSYSLRVNWKDLQPVENGPLSTGALDALLADAASRSARVRLRVFAGASAPDWAKRLGGDPVVMIDPFDGKQGEIGRFWTPAFGAAYEDLQAALAARYDGDPTVAEVIISRCTVFYPEPFLRQTSVLANRSALLAAGYTVEADHMCHREEIDAHQVWTATRSGLAFNPYQELSTDGTVTVDDAFTVDMMRHCRERLGSRCILENNSIRTPIAALDPNPAEPHYQLMYEAMTEFGPPLSFQTAVEARIGDCSQTLAWAIERHAASVELPKNPEAGGCTPDVLAAADDRLGHPTAPRALRVTAGPRRGQRTLRWSAPESDCGAALFTYHVYRATTGGTAWLIGQVPGTATTFVDKHPPSRRQLTYTVRAINAAGAGQPTSVTIFT
jgi:hypothetical protein